MSFWRAELLKLIAMVKERQPLDDDLTSWAAITRAAGFDAFAATPSSANLRALLPDETGTGAAVFAGAPTITGIPIFSGIPSLTGGALTFPATQVPSAGANDLDDYEEGTWTPTLTFATPGNLSVVYSFRVGKYTKIGRIVILEVDIRTTTFTHTTASGALNITGMPFAPAADVAPGSLDFQGITMAGYTQFSWNVAAGATSITVVANASASARAGIATTNMPTGGTVILRGILIYSV